MGLIFKSNGECILDQESLILSYKIATAKLVGKHEEEFGKLLDREIKIMKDGLINNERWINKYDASKGKIIEYS